MNPKNPKDKIKEELEKVKEEETKLTDLSVFQNYQGEDRVITSKEAWQLLAEERKKPIIRFNTKIPTLDRMIDGFRKGDLITISAPTKQGKTTLAQTFTHGFSENNISSLWFSYELRQLDFLEKFGEKLPYFALPKKLEGNSLSWIEERIMEAIAKYGIQVVFIDHLHFLLDMSFIGQRGNVSLLIGSIMRRLKQIALKYEITIVLIAHTTKINFEKTPDLNDIRDSSFISQESDTVLMIWRLMEKGNYIDKARLGVLANRRNGRTGIIKLDLINNRFYEETENYGEDNL